MMFADYIKSLVENTDLSDQDAVQDALLELGYQCTVLHRFLMKTDKQLQIVLTKDEYNAWSSRTAKEAFIEELENMPESDFKYDVLQWLEGGNDILKEDILN